jgi:hypothetical protein
VTRLTARDPRRFQRLHRFSLTINDSNKPGNLLSLKKQLPRLQQMGFGHSSGTVEKQGRSLAVMICPTFLRKNGLVPAGER